MLHLECKYQVLASRVSYPSTLPVLPLLGESSHVIATYLIRWIAYCIHRPNPEQHYQFSLGRTFHIWLSLDRTSMTLRRSTPQFMKKFWSLWTLPCSGHAPGRQSLQPPASYRVICGPHAFGHRTFRRLTGMGKFYYMLSISFLHVSCSICMNITSEHGEEVVIMNLLVNLPNISYYHFKIGQADY